MNIVKFEITSLSTVCLTAYADSHQRNIQVRITGHSWEEFTDDRWIPGKKGQ